jgi:methionyl-tRNA synthetase
MIQQYRQGKLPATPADSPLADAAREVIRTTRATYDSFEFSRGLEVLWSLLSQVDKSIVEHAPWTLSKKNDPESQERLDRVLATAAEVVRIATVLLYPVIPGSAAAIWKQLGMTAAIDKFPIDTLEWGQLPAGQQIGEIAAVFPRIDAKTAIEKMRALEVEETARQAALLGKSAQAAESETQGQIAPLAPEIGIDDFTKVDLRVGRVVSAEPVKGADKLLSLKVDIGEPDPRPIVAGIAKVYKPESLIGRKVVIVANLQPRKLRGVESRGMIVAASLEGGPPVLAGFLEDVPVGARLK